MKNIIVYFIITCSLFSCNAQKTNNFNTDDKDLLERHIEFLQSKIKDSLLYLYNKPINNYIIAKTFFEESESERMIKVYNEFNPDKKLETDSLKLYIYKDKNEVNNYLNQLNDNFEWIDLELKIKDFIIDTTDISKPISLEKLNQLKPEIERLLKLKKENYSKYDYEIEKQISYYFRKPFQLSKPLYTIDKKFAIICEISKYSTHGKLKFHVYKNINEKWEKYN